MSRRLLAAAGCLLLALPSGCADPQPSSSNSSVTTQPSKAPVASASPGARRDSPPVGLSSGRGCDREPVYEIMCRFVDAVQTGDASALGEAERAVADGGGGDLPSSDYTVEDCVLVGDVTVACEVSFPGQSGVFGFHVVPTNAEYNDGQLITPDGGDVRYEVEGYLGRGQRGEFASLP